MPRNRVLVISIVAAAIWHLFWISAIKVVIIPEDLKVVKFPKISFLGPVIGGRVLEIRTTLRPRSSLEKRLAKYTGELAPIPVVARGDDFAKDFFTLTDEEHSSLMSNSIAREKTAPPANFSE